MEDAKITATPAHRRLLISIVVGVLAGVLFSLNGHSEFVALVSWDTAAMLYIIWTWATVWPMNAAVTKTHARQEDTGRTFTDILLITASLVSLVAVGILIVKAGDSHGLTKGLDIFFGLASVVVSWAAVQTTYALRYARLYYGDPEGGIDFNQPKPPHYSDFAYMAFTLGMTFQVSDTALKTKELRKTALKQALLSYVFGTVIIATTINTIASLAK